MNRKLLLLAIFFSFCTTLKAQMVYLPDTAWKNFLMTQGLSSCITGDSLDASCPAILGITTLDCRNRYINDISGIGYFSNLTKFYCWGNNLTNLPMLPIGLEELYCSGNQIYILDSLPPNLVTLNCSYNSIQFLDNLPLGLKHLYCNNNFLNSINSFFDSLITLDCSFNQLQFLPPGQLPYSLKSLKFTGNSISGGLIPPPYLDTLEFSNNQISTLFQLPYNLKKLECNFNSLSILPSLPNNLLDISCSNNYLNNLPTLPPNLIKLLAEDNFLTQIPTIPSTLKKLYLSGNQISSLPTLPDSLRELYISRNLFTALPQLPSQLIYLTIDYNNISVIDSFPPRLTYLHADSCQLTSLPACPQTLSGVYVSQNIIQSIESLPDSMYILDISSNPISCLPNLLFANTIAIGNTNIHCLPNRVQFNWSDINPDTIPLCAINSGCPINWNIRGHVNHDLNLDCNHDSSENFLHNIPVILKSGGVVRQVSYSTRYGEYSFKAPFGSYFVMVDTASEPFKYNCPIGGYTYITLNTTDSISDSLDFHLKCRITNDKIVKSVTPTQAFRPGRPTRVDINAGDASTYHGTTCFNDTGIVYVILSSNVSYIGPASGALTPTQVNGDTLIWTIPDFSTVVPSRDFNIQLTTSTTATIGDTVCIQVVIQPINDFDSTNNIIQECFPVRASFDPNEKWISPEVADTSDHEFTFTILFQNTGTAPAYDIYLIDTLDNDLNASTFELLGSSHEVVTSIFPGNIVRFNFNAIELPDSNSNEAGSHGFVKYRIKRKSNTGAGTEITNTAYIYFDYNAPIVTNTVRVEIATPVGTSEFYNNEITIYPNPANQFLTVSSKNKIEQIQLFDIFGKLVLSKLDLNSNSINLSVANLNKGIYFISIKENNSSSISNNKIVIQ